MTGRPSVDRDGRPTDPTAEIRRQIRDEMAWLKELQSCRDSHRSDRSLIPGSFISLNALIQRAMEQAAERVSDLIDDLHAYHAERN